MTLRAGTHHVRAHDRQDVWHRVVFPSLNIKRALPLNEPVAIEFTAGKSGEIAFACGMNMLKGFVGVQKAMRGVGGYTGKRRKCSRPIRRCYTIQDFPTVQLA